MGADALAIVTEWKEFRSPDFTRIAATRLKTPVIFDGRNLYEPKVVRDAGIDYQPIGRVIGACENSKSPPVAGSELTYDEQEHCRCAVPYTDRSPWLIAALLLAACTGHKKDATQSAARVDGTEITDAPRSTFACSASVASGLTRMPPAARCSSA